jgi:hypothetical protein
VPIKFYFILSSFELEAMNQSKGGKRGRTYSGGSPQNPPPYTYPHQGKRTDDGHGFAPHHQPFRGGGGLPSWSRPTFDRDQDITRADKLHIKMLVNQSYSETDCEEMKDELLSALAVCARSDSHPDQITSVFTILAQDSLVAKKIRNWLISSKSVVIFDKTQNHYSELLLSDDGLCNLVLTTLGKCLDSAADNYSLHNSIRTVRDWVSSGKNTMIADALWNRTVEVANRSNAQELTRRGQVATVGEGRSARTCRQDEKFVMYDLDVFPSVEELLTPVDRKRAVDSLFHVDRLPFMSLKVHMDTQYQLLRADFAINFCHGFQIAHKRVRYPRQVHQRNMSARVYTDVTFADPAFTLNRFRGITFTFIVNWK